MMRQWARIKREYPDCIVLFRLGDFYEAFGEDAVRLAELCDVVLTSRPVAKDERIPMAGVPYHAVDGYIAQLVRRGVKVAIAEQTGAEASPEKRARMSGSTPPEADRGPGSPEGRLLSRQVVRIVTPGTLVEGDLLDARANNYLAGLAVMGEQLGLAHVDVSTGEFATMEVGGPDADRRLIDELVRVRPAELLYSDGQSEVIAGLVGRFQEAASALGINTSIVPYAAWRFDVANARRRLLDHFGTVSLEAFGCEALPAATAAAGAVLAYIGDTQAGALRQLRSLTTYSIDRFMTLDGATRRQLEITSTLRGERKGSLLWALDATVTPMGARLLRSWLDQPLLDIKGINARLDTVEVFVQDGAWREKLRSKLKPMPDIGRLASRTVSGYAGPRELVALAHGLRLAAEVAQEVAGRGMTLPEGTEALAGPELTAIAERIEAGIVDEPPAVLGVAGAVRPGYSAELDAIHAAVAEARQWIAGLEGAERARTGIRGLKVGYNRVFGYYIEVPKAQTAKVPDDYSRKQTLVDAERYITPELKVREAEVLNAEERIVALERELFGALVEDVRAAQADIQAATQWVATLDALLSLAEVAAAHGYRRPCLNESRGLILEAARHPVVERMLTEIPFVPNDLLMSEGEIILLTGPNMAGKSTVARQTALIVLMAQMGSFVPAGRAEIGLVDRIFARVGAQDELGLGRSTFMVEMLETAAILRQATPRSLLILDELGRGTSTYDGMAIAWAVVEHIHSQPRLRCRTIFATHYHELTSLVDSLPRLRLYNMAVSEVDGRVVFLHRVEPGAADRSYGIHVAELAGLPQEVIERAWEVLARLEAEGNAPLQDARSRPPRSQARQLALFAPLSEEHPVVKALADLDPDALTPRQALEKLYELRSLLRPRAP